MSIFAHPIVVIPARLSASRLPNKPLANIHGEPMIVHVWKRAVEADIGPVIVACGEQEIADAVDAAGGISVLTTSDLPSGSDRVYEAVVRFDPDSRYDTVVNVQGDLPTIEPSLIKIVLDPFIDADVDISTLASKIVIEEERKNRNVVKVAIAFSNQNASVGRALYFSRSMIPSAATGPHFHHIGIYGYKRRALERFVALPCGRLENLEKLEQLRALENGMRIDIVCVDTNPLGVDTPADLERARTIVLKGSA